MASFEEELLLDAEDDARTIAFIRSQLPVELKEKFSDDELYYFLDVIVEHLSDSGILDAEADEEGYVDIDMEAIADHVAKKAKAEGIGTYSTEDLLFVVQAQLDFALEEE